MEIRDFFLRTWYNGSMITDEWTINYIPEEGGRFTGKDGQTFVFDYGLLSVGKLVEAVKSVISR